MRLPTLSCFTVRSDEFVRIFALGVVEQFAQRL